MSDTIDEKPKARPSEDARKSDQEISRDEKILKLAEAGVDLFPYRAEKTHSVHEVVRDYSALASEELGEKKVPVVVPGRIMSIRKMGRATFATISDSRARLQIYLREDQVGEKAYQIFSWLDIGDIIDVQGTLFKTRTGELTVLVSSCVLLAKCLHPLPEKWHGLQDVELRYRRRYLDLIMNPDSKAVFEKRGRIIRLIRNYLEIGRAHV